MPPTVIYVDVDDTLIRSAGSKRIPIPATIARVRHLHQSGVTLYLWSSGGADYARATAVELNLTECFSGFLPKPTAIIDDQHFTEWRDLRHYFPHEDVSL
jgi:hydroxymethylpyrimidine pyrophosphatase-like HAD family hydrolase